MVQTSKSNPNGGSNGEITELPQASQSTNGENPSTSDTSVIIAEVKSRKDSQLTPNSHPENPNTAYVQIIFAFVAKLGKLVEIKKIALQDGRDGWAIFFPTESWEVDPVSKILKPR